MKTTKVRVSRKKRVLSASLVIGVIVVFGGAGVLLRWWQDRDEPIRSKELSAAVEKSQNLAIGGNYAEAQEEIDAALEREGLTAEERYGLYLQQGANYHNQDRYQQALDSYKKAAEVKPTQNIYNSLAEIAQKLGDSEAAIAYYKKAIANIADTNPVGETDKEVYEAKIRELGGEP